jgi:hypothetical protein
MFMDDTGGLNPSFFGRLISAPAFSGGQITSDFRGFVPSPEIKQKAEYISHNTLNGNLETSRPEEPSLFVYDVIP